MTPSNKKFLAVMSVLILISFINLLMSGLWVTMFVLTITSLASYIMFWGASKYGWGTDGLLLHAIVSKGRKSGLTPSEVYARGRFVSGLMFIIILAIMLLDTGS